MYKTEKPSFGCHLTKLYGILGIVLIILGIPFLAGQNSAWILVPMIGSMIETIVTMAIDSLVIEKRYKKKPSMK